jgi:hypothetical protein
MLDTALRFAEYEPEPFIAPIPTNGIVEVFTLQNNVPLRYSLYKQTPGWWEVIPGRRAVLGREAYAHETLEYLESLPRFYSIACVPSGDNIWLVVPYNASDASQRGWKNGEPKQVYLVSESINPFDVIVVRSLAGLLLYDSVDYRLGTFTKSELCRTLIENKSGIPNERDWRNAFNIVYDWESKAMQNASRAKIENQMASASDRMKFLLEFMGAKLIANEKKGNGYQVTWQAPDGHTYKMGVREDGRIAVAGFCMANTDSVHNLSSIVHVMLEGQRQNRPDINQAYANYEPDDEDYDEDN